jgi:hypothetical protein
VAIGRFFFFFFFFARGYSVVGEGQEEVRLLRCSRRAGPCGGGAQAPLARGDNAALPAVGGALASS